MDDNIFSPPDSPPFQPTLPPATEPPKQAARKTTRRKSKVKLGPNQKLLERVTRKAFPRKAPALEKTGTALSAAKLLRITQGFDQDQQKQFIMLLDYFEQQLPVIRNAFMKFLT